MALSICRHYSTRVYVFYHSTHSHTCTTIYTHGAEKKDNWHTDLLDKGGNSEKNKKTEETLQSEMKRHMRKKKNESQVIQRDVE